MDQSENLWTTEYTVGCISIRHGVVYFIVHCSLKNDLPLHPLQRGIKEETASESGSGFWGINAKLSWRRSGNGRM